MVDYVSTQSGTWSSAATWGGSGIPGDGDSATIANGHTVTLTGPVTVGTGGATGTLAVNVQSGGALVRNAGAVLTARGDIRLNRGASMTGAAGSHIILRPPLGARYKIDLYESGSGRIAWSETGATGTPTRISTNTLDGGDPGWIRKHFSASLGVSVPADIAWSYVELVDLGSSTNLALDIRLENDESFVWTNGLLLRYGQYRIELAGGTPTYNVQAVSFRVSQNPELMSLRGGNPNTTGTRRMRVDIYESTTNRYIDDRMKHINWSGSVLAQVTHQPTVGPYGQTADGLFFVTSVARNWGNPGNGGCVLQNAAFVFPGDVNVHIYAESGNEAQGYNEFQDPIFDGCGLTSVDNEVGDIIPQFDLYLTRPLIVANACNVTLLAAAARLWVDRPTFHSNVGINVGEGAGSATQLQRCKNALFVNGNRGISQDGLFVSQTDAVVDFNAFHGMTDPNNLDVGTANSYMGQAISPWWDSGAQYNQAAGRGLNDFEANPQFTDPTRNALTWLAANGGSGGILGIMTEICKVHGYDAAGAPATFDSAYSLASYRAYMREGYTPTNAALVGAGDPADGAPDIGAINISSAPPPASGGVAFLNSFNGGFNA